MARRSSSRDRHQSASRNRSRSRSRSRSPTTRKRGNNDQRRSNSPTRGRRSDHSHSHSSRPRTSSSSHPHRSSSSRDPKSKRRSSSHRKKKRRAAASSGNDSSESERDTALTHSSSFTFHSDTHQTTTTRTVSKKKDTEVLETEEPNTIQTLRPSKRVPVAQAPTEGENKAGAATLTLSTRKSFSQPLFAASMVTSALATSLNAVADLNKSILAASPVLVPLPALPVPTPTPSAPVLPLPSTPAVNVNLMKENVLRALALARQSVASLKGKDEKEKDENGETALKIGKGDEQDPLDASAIPLTPAEPLVGLYESFLPLPVSSFAPLHTSRVESNPSQENLERDVSFSTPTSVSTTVTRMADTEAFDMFAPPPVVKKMEGTTSDTRIATSSSQPLQASEFIAAVAVTGLTSDWDDAEGYYRCLMGEGLHDDTYRVVGTAGAGVFSTVLHCSVLKGPRQGSQVAIKLIRNNEVMRKAAIMERSLLALCHKAKYVVNCFESFEHRGHTALVFEPMAMNVRDAMKKYGGKSGISITAVKRFAKHLFCALSTLQSHSIVHADIKPDNILLDQKETLVKLCDLGSAFRMNSDQGNAPTPYLVSRFYRAPEIILGFHYNTAVDVWAVGCCLIEMLTGKILFPGTSNNEMLKFMMASRGKLSTKLIKKHKSVYVDTFEREPHFDAENRFISREIDRVTGNPIVRLLDFNQPIDLATLMVCKGTKEEKKQVGQLKALLERVLVLDASKRITVNQALAHPFLMS